MSEHIQQLFDNIAPRYDLLNSVLSWKVDSLWRKKAVAVISSNDFKNVLDLCAGTLALTTTLLDANPACHITAVDFSEKMLEVGQSKLSKEHRPRVTVLVQDAMKLQPPQAQYDAVMCAYGLRNIENNEIVLQKSFSLLRPGGKLVVLEFFRRDGFFGKLFDVTYSQVIIPVLGKLISRHPQAYQHLRDSVRNYYSVSEYKDLLKKTGFGKITTRSLTGGISHLVVAEKA